jgi:hypothetical protein
MGLSSSRNDGPPSNTTQNRHAGRNASNDRPIPAKLRTEVMRRQLSQPLEIARSRAEPAQEIMHRPCLSRRGEIHGGLANSNTESFRG